MFAGRDIAATVLAFGLGACATTPGTFPTLERRPAERVTGSANPAPADAAAPTPDLAAPPALAADLQARLIQIEARAEAGHARFQTRESRARQLVSAARGAAVASESWSVATIAVAELEAARSLVMIALADLDTLYAAERVAGRNAAPIAAVRSRVAALVAREDAVLANLGTVLRS